MYSMNIEKHILAIIVCRICRFRRILTGRKLKRCSTTRLLNHIRTNRPKPVWDGLTNRTSQSIPELQTDRTSVPNRLCWFQPRFRIRMISLPIILNPRLALFGPILKRARNETREWSDAQSVPRSIQ